ncbi:MAG: DUF2695 domain-containing protein [Candidatus Thorarchaeota archaeon]
MTDHIDFEKMQLAIDIVEEKCNFHCKRFPDRECSGCDISESCGMKEITWVCQHDLRFFIEGLGLAGVDSSQFDLYVDYVKFHGGYCDCEILFNVVEHLPSCDEGVNVV